MAGQSIKATPNGIKKAEKVLTGNAWSREDLAGKVVIEGQRRTTGINIQTIHKFFTGKAVARIYFVGICNALNLDWEQIAEIVTELKDKSSIPVQEEYNDSSLDVFVQSIKKTIESSIKTRKSHNLSAFSEKYNDLTLMLDPSKTIEVDKNYINIKLFQKNADSKQTIENTLFQEQGFNSKANQFQNNSKEYILPVEAVEKYSRLMVFGRAGVGKTTFLKYLAFQCNQGQFSVERIPIFISLKNFAETEQQLIKPKGQKESAIENKKNQPSLFNYISRQFLACQIEISQIQYLLNSGRLLILLDGLNEINNKYSSDFLVEIINFINEFSSNHFVITSQELSGNNELPEFVDTEIQDFVIPVLLEARENISNFIKQRCSTMRVLEMNQPIELGDIYTNVNILEKITATQRLEINDLLKISDRENFDRPGLSNITEKRVSGLMAVEKYSKLLILGKPGAGKTTFLKYIAIQCNLGDFKNNYVPIFITLKDFAETKNKLGLFEFIVKQFEIYKLKQASTKLELLLSKGMALILLDGLDEVRKEDNDRVITEIRDFSEKFHNNHYIMTCRISAREYTFEKFTEVEIADFDNHQIATFASNWFKSKDLIKSKNFIFKLNENPPIKELATNPLLLTLLCLVFEETANFPSNRSELYEEGLDILLKKWDAERNIERDTQSSPEHDEAYKKLSSQRKQDLLSHLALRTFEKKDFFFKKRDAEAYITDYISNLSKNPVEPETLKLDSETILKSIEAQHGLLIERSRGIYSFSHLTFHEYFTARKLVANQKGLERLANHTLEKHWREVFLLAVDKLQEADELIQLMKKHIDDFSISSQNLKILLTQVNQKANSVQSPYKLAALRAFYFELIHTPYLAFNISRSVIMELHKARTYARELALALESACALKLAPELELANELGFDLATARTHARSLDLDLTNGQILDLDFVRFFALSLYIDLALVTFSNPPQIFQNLKMQQPDLNVDRQVFKEWWRTREEILLNPDLLKLLRDGAYLQNAALKQYYDANKLLIDCLNSNCYITRTIRDQVEENLLLLPV